MNKNNISAWCYSDPPNSPWILSCVYGPPVRKDKFAFWEKISAIGENFDENFDRSWLCIGDFNHVLNQYEKKGGRPMASSSSCPFKNFIDRYGMIDLGFAGNSFTWSNNRQGQNSIKERLDRSLATIQWIHLHPKFSLIHILAFSFDHNSILFNTASSSLFLPRPFRFEEFWTKGPSCGLIIGAAWKLVVSGNLAFCLVKKLKHTQVALKRYNSLHFGNIQEKIKSTMTKIDQVQSVP